MHTLEFEEKKKEHYAFLMHLTQNEAFSEELARELAESDLFPEAFKTKQGDFWGSPITQKDQTLCYLIKKLEDHDYAYLLDWKNDHEELNEAILALSKGQFESIVEEDDEDDCETMFELLEVAEERLADEGYSLFYFPLEGDCYVISLVKTAEIEKLEAAAAYLN